MCAEDFKLDFGELAGRYATEAGVNQLQPLGFLADLIQSEIDEVSLIPPRNRKNVVDNASIGLLQAQQLAALLIVSLTGLLVIGVDPKEYFVDAMRRYDSQQSSTLTSKRSA